MAVVEAVVAAVAEVAVAEEGNFRPETFRPETIRPKKLLFETTLYSRDALRLRRLRFLDPSNSNFNQ